MTFVNERDPLKRTGPQSQHELLAELARLLSGRTTEDVCQVAVNLLINALRQAHATRTDAEKAIDEWTGKAKTILLDQHYEVTGGRRKAIYPYTQVLGAPFADFRKKW